MTGQQRRSGRYPVEFKERAVRMVAEAESQGRSRWQAIQSVAEKLGLTGETIRAWVKRHEIDNGTLPGTTSDDVERIKQLERENRELKRANEILKSASAFFVP